MRGLLCIENKLFGIVRIVFRSTNLGRKKPDIIFHSYLLVVLGNCSFDIYSSKLMFLSKTLPTSRISNTEFLNTKLIVLLNVRSTYCLPLISCRLLQYLMDSIEECSLPSLEMANSTSSLNVVPDTVAGIPVGNSLISPELSQDQCTSWLDFFIENHFWNIWLTNVCLYPGVLVLLYNFLLYFIFPTVRAVLRSALRRETRFNEDRWNSSEDDSKNFKGFH